MQIAYNKAHQFAAFGCRTRCARRCGRRYVPKELTCYEQV